MDKGDKWNVWPNALAHAFPHWSFEKTTAEGDAAMVCDIQGVGFKYTDVTVHTAKRRFGSTDLGERGFEKFFETHTCNDVCKQLGLHLCENTACSAAGGAAAASASTATERIEIIRTKHLQSRKRQRGVDTIEMQRAVKRGTKEPGSGPGNVKHTHQGVSVVTDGTHKVGVTAFRTGGARGPPGGAAPAVPTFAAWGN